MSDEWDMTEAMELRDMEEDELRDELESLRVQLAEAIKTLQFYAREDNYLHGPQGYASYGLFHKKSHIDEDMGQKAQDTLERLK